MEEIRVQVELLQPKYNKDENRSFDRFNQRMCTYIDVKDHNKEHKVNEEMERIYEFTQCDWGRSADIGDLFVVVDLNEFSYKTYVVCACGFAEANEDMIAKLRQDRSKARDFIYDNAIINND